MVSNIGNVTTNMCRNLVKMGLPGLLLLVSAMAISAQDCPHPGGCVTISREAALKALADADRVKALEAELKVKDVAIEDLKKLLADMRVEFARCSGEATILKQRAVSDAAMIELLSKMVRPKKVGFINLF